MTLDRIPWALVKRETERGERPTHLAVREYDESERLRIAETLVRCREIEERNALVGQALHARLRREGKLR